MKALIILSTFLNLVIFGLIGFFVFVKKDDASFFYEYMRKNEAEKEIIRTSPQLFADVPEEAKTELKKLLEVVRGALTKEQFEKWLAEPHTPVEIQELLVTATRTTIANNDERMREEQASIERFKMLRKDYADFTKDLDDKHASIERDQKAFDENKLEWESIKKNGDITLLIERINKSKKSVEFLSQVQDRPVKEQVYIFSQIKKPEAASDLFNALPADQQAAIKREQSNPLGAPMGSIGDTSTSR